MSGGFRIVSTLRYTYLLLLSGDFTPYSDVRLSATHTQNAVFAETKQFTAKVSIDDQQEELRRLSKELIPGSPRRA